MSADTFKTIRWLIVAAALVAVAIGCRPQIHVYLHHDVMLQPLKK